MITLKCKACNASMDSNAWVESIQDYNDLCYTCLEAIGYDDETNLYSISAEATLFLEEADKEAPYESEEATVSTPE